MNKLLLCLSAAVATLAACLAGGPEDLAGPGHGGDGGSRAEVVNEAPARIVEGPCADACRAVMSGACDDWKDQCSDGYWPAVAFCADHVVWCDAAWYTEEHHNAAGLEYCWRDCENLH